MNRVLFSKQSDEWSTPQDLYNKLDAEFGFTLDAAATAQNRKCSTWISKGSLVNPWQGPGIPSPIVWLNPPYSQCRQFIAKAAVEAQAGCTVVCLVPSRTDTQWWHEYVWDQTQHQPRPGVSIRFLKGRLKFGNVQNHAPFPSVLIIFTPLTKEQEKI